MTAVWSSRDGRVINGNLQKPLVRGDQGLRNEVIYIPREFSSSGAARGIQGLPAGSYTARWFNPRNGGFSLINKQVVPGTYGTWTIPSKLDADDWVLDLRAN